MLCSCVSHEPDKPDSGSYGLDKAKAALLAASVLQTLVFFKRRPNPIGIVHIAPTSPPTFISAPFYIRIQSARRRTLPGVATRLPHCCPHEHASLISVHLHKRAPRETARAIAAAPTNNKHSTPWRPKQMTEKKARTPRMIPLWRRSAATFLKIPPSPKPLKREFRRMRRASTLH